MAASKPLTNISSLFVVKATEQRQCDSHGEYTAQLMSLPGGRELWTHCPQCEKDRVKAEDEAMQAQMAAERRKARIETMLGHAAIPKRFLNRTLENYDTTLEGQQKAHRAAVRYATEWRDNLQAGHARLLARGPRTFKLNPPLAVGQPKQHMDDYAIPGFGSDIYRSDRGLRPQRKHPD